MAFAVTRASLARLAWLAFGVIATCSMGVSRARAQRIDSCPGSSVDVERLRTLVQVEATSFDVGSLERVHIEIRDCSEVSATVVVDRDGRLLDSRRVDLDDAAANVRLRLLAYVVVEILLASAPVQAPPSLPRDGALAAADSSSGAAGTPVPAVPSAEELALTRNHGTTLRPWHVTLDGGVRWLAASHTHLGTYRLTSNIGRMLFELRHSFGPLLGQPLRGELGDETVLFQSITLGLGFRYRHPFGDDAFFVDGVGSAGLLFLQHYDRNDGSLRGATRFATAGLEARAGLDIGFGRLRGSVAVELGYVRPRNGPKADFDPPPVLRHASGVFLGMTIGLGWETRSGLRGMASSRRRRLLGESNAPAEPIVTSNH